MVVTHQNRAPSTATQTSHPSFLLDRLFFAIRSDCIPNIFIHRKHRMLSLLLKSGFSFFQERDDQATKLRIFADFWH